MALLIIFGIFFVIWLFSSNTKKQDLNNLGNSISKGLDSINDGLDNLNKELKLQSKRDEIERFYKILQILNDSNQLRKVQGLPPRTIQNFFESDSDFKDYTQLEEYKDLVRKEKLGLLENTSFRDVTPKTSTPSRPVKPIQKITREPQPQPQPQPQPKAKTIYENTSIIKVDDSPNEPIETPFKIKKSKFLDELNNNSQDLTNTLNRTSNPHEKLINFIYIRYFLTGHLNYPNLKCVNDCLSNMNPSIPQKHLNLVWHKTVRDLYFDESKRKKIDSIYHFTHISNLYSILGYGLLTRDFLESSGMQFMFNDEHRWDNVKDSISLSFTHPNYKMFFKYRKQTKDEDWIVLKINTELLSGNTNPNLPKLNDFDYLNKAIFCTKNAASMAIKNIPIENRKKYETFLDMFESPIGMTLPTYTVDNQAEILFQGNIPKDFIVEIYTQSYDPRLEWVKEFGYNVTVKPEVFMKR